VGQQPEGVGGVPTVGHLGERFGHIPQLLGGASRSAVRTCSNVRSPMVTVMRAWAPKAVRYSDNVLRSTSPRRSSWDTLPWVVDRRAAISAWVTPASCRISDNSIITQY